jgi:hypothetical protein
MNIAVEKKETNPITHGIGITEEKKDWVDPDKARMDLLHEAAKAAEDRLRKGKGKETEEGSEASFKETPKIPSMFVRPEDRKPALTSGLGELLGLRRRKSEGEAASDSAYHRKPILESFGASSSSPSKDEKYTGRAPFESLLTQYDGLGSREEINKFCKDVIGYDPSGTSSSDWKKQIKSSFKKRLKEKREQWKKEEH